MLKDQKSTVRNDTIAAIATPKGQGGIGIVRISGPDSLSIAESICCRSFSPVNSRQAILSPFHNKFGKAIDQGIVIFFPSPSSFTGEDIIELHGHGGSTVLSLLLDSAIEYGARMAKPGEFTLRAFLNNKIDLVQAEAIADLISSKTALSAQFAVRSLEGEFSERIEYLVSSITALRARVEAMLDFPEEEIEEMTVDTLRQDIQQLLNLHNEIIQSVKSGIVYSEGLRIIIAGRPNVGKSSLLNALTGQERAIVTEFPGTTRDIIREFISIDDIPIQLVDTAGLRDTDNVIELEGIRRTRKELSDADLVLFVVDDSLDEKLFLEEYKISGNIPVTIVRNKIDLTGRLPGTQFSSLNVPEIAISVLRDEGIIELKNHIKSCAGLSNHDDGIFVARKRHKIALESSLLSLEKSIINIDNDYPIEILAEDLAHAHRHLSEITGKFVTEDLLEKIFSSFCIGK